AAAVVRASPRRLRTLGQRPSSHGVPDTFISEAIDRVIVHHAYGLHAGVADRRPHELEAPAQKVSAQSVGLRRPRGYLPQRSPAIHARGPANKAPHVGIKAPELVLDRQ